MVCYLLAIHTICYFIRGIMLNILNTPSVIFLGLLRYCLAGSEIFNDISFIIDTLFKSDKSVIFFEIQCVNIETLF